VTRRRGPAVAAGLAALITLVALVVGLPVLLYKLGGSPLPSHVPSIAQIGHALLHRDSGGVFLAAVRDISWIAWVLFTLAVLVEVQAVLRRRTPPRLWLGGMQGAAGRLVAIAALAFTTAPVGTLLVAPQAAHAAVMTVVPRSGMASLPQAGVTYPAPAGAASALSQHAGSPGAQEDAIGAEPAVSQGKSMGFVQLVTVKPGDCLWTIAQRYLGNGDRYHEIVSLNLGHDMGHGQVFSDPSVVWTGWVLHVPTAGQHTDGGGSHAGHQSDAGGSGGAGRHSSSASGSGSAGDSGHGAHGGHPSGHQHFRHPHPAASATPSGQAPSGQASSGAVASPSATASTPAPATGGQASSPPASFGQGSGSSAGQSGGQASGGGSAAGGSAGQGSPGTTTLQPVASTGQGTELPLILAFGTGVLAGGAAVSLARLRHRQRQTRRRGRRIPLPSSAPVAEAEQRLNLAAADEPLSGLRGTLHGLAAALLATGQAIPEITAIRLQTDSLDVLLASPAVEPPPAPFTVPGGRQGMAWRLSLADELPEPSVEAGDLLPGLLTAGTSDGGYLLIDLEHLQVTTVSGPASMTAAVLRSAAAELATGQLAGWYDLILVGFPELAALGGRGTCCDSLDAGLDLLAAKAVALRRRLGDAPLADVRYHRLAEPGDEDWALTLLVSCLPATPGQLALLSDLAGDPGGIAALVPGGVEAPGGHRTPGSIDLAAGPVGSETMIARIWPLQLEAEPQLLDDSDYEALTSLFAMAGEEHDVAPEEPPYDSWTWPPDVAGRDDDVRDNRSAAEPAADEAVDDLEFASDAGSAQDDELAAEPRRAGDVHWSAAPGWAGEPIWNGAPGWSDDPGAAAGPGWLADAGPAHDLGVATQARSADPGWPGGSGVTVDAVWSADSGVTVDPVWSAGSGSTGDPAWAGGPDPTADPVWSAGPGRTGEPAWPADPSLTSDPAWLTDPSLSAERDWPADLPAAPDPGWASDSGLAPNQGVAPHQGWSADPAVVGLPGQPAAWLQDGPAEGVPAGSGDARPAGPADLGDGWQHGPATAGQPTSPMTGQPPATGQPRTPGPPLSLVTNQQEPPAASRPDAAESEQQNLRIGVLGTFTINGQPGSLLPAQSQLVLALALNGSSGLSNQQLCYLLGADPDHPKPSDSLRQLIVRTRRQLGRSADGREWIEHLGGGQYALHPGTRFDWHEFDALTTEGLRTRDAQRLRRALGLIRGRPFTGCYYWWLDLALTETVRAQIVDAADVLAALELAAGEPAAAARAARIGLAGDGAAEQLWRALMRAEHAAGNLTGVREAWNRCLDAISEIAPDGEPHPETAALYRELLGSTPTHPVWARN
jgi:DNA-binding SARP family transcriptional activator